MCVSRCNRWLRACVRLCVCVLIWPGNCIILITSLINVPKWTVNILLSLSLLLCKNMRWYMQTYKLRLHTYYILCQLFNYFAVLLFFFCLACIMQCQSYSAIAFIVVARCRQRLSQQTTWQQMATTFWVGDWVYDLAEGGEGGLLGLELTETETKTNYNDNDNVNCLLLCKYSVNTHTYTHPEPCLKGGLTWLLA